jgi:hypothetical protein
MSWSRGDTFIGSAATAALTCLALGQNVLSLTRASSKAILVVMKAGSSRRDFIRRTCFGAAIGGLLANAPGASISAQADSRSVDRRRLGRLDAEVSILGLGLGGAFMDWYDRNLDASHARWNRLLLKASIAGIRRAATARARE